jgi:DNA-binding Xre family transcriptional regulator
VKNAVGAKIIAAMENKGWTRYQLVKKSGVSSSTVYCLGEKSSVTTDTLIKLASALDLNLDDLLR